METCVFSGTNDRVLGTALSVFLWRHRLVSFYDVSVATDAGKLDFTEF